jgi:hypothetical protein
MPPLRREMASVRAGENGMCGKWCANMPRLPCARKESGHTNIVATVLKCLIHALS